MKIALIITARNKSSRLPNKHMLEVNGKKIIEILIERLSDNKNKYPIILATTTDKSDDALEKVAKKFNIVCYRGHKLNVKGRVLAAAKKNKIDHIIKIWGDSPLIDHKIINKALKKYLIKMPDVLTTNKIQRLPEGMDFHIYSTKSLEKSLKLSKKPEDYEHVDQIFFKYPKKFKIIEFIPPKKNFYPSAALLIDEYNDYLFIKKLLEKALNVGKNFKISCEEIIKILKKNPELLQINSKVIRTKKK